MCILLAGDIATNPGPACSSTSLRCLSFNAQSLGSHNSTTSKLKSFQDLVYGETLDVITITETWLNDKIFDNEILPNGYNIIRKDRSGKKRGGGVLIALRENIPYNIVLPSNAKRNWHDLLEIVAIEIQLNKNSKKALLCVCYRSQKYKTECRSQMFTEFLQDTQNYDLILITGDFNFPELTWNSTLVASRPVSAHSVEFRELTLDFFLEQTNTHSTRGDNILDLVFSRTPEAIKDLTCICPKTMNISSDHALLMFDFHLIMSSFGCTKELLSISNVLIGMVYRTSYAFQICLQQITQI